MKKRKIKSLYEIAPEDIRTNVDRIWSLIDHADYVKAFRIADNLLKRHPKDFFVNRTYAMLLADSAEAYDLKERRKRKKRACEILRCLLRKPLGQPPLGVPLKEFYAVRNELYFHSGQSARQVALGKKYFGQLPSAAYSVCVGNAWRAARYFCAGNLSKAKKYARQSLMGAQDAMDAFPGFYNVLVHVALAAGIAEGMQSADGYLKKAKKLSGKPDDHFEFEEVREVLMSRKLRDRF